MTVDKSCRHTASRRPKTQHTAKTRHEALPPAQSRAGCIYRAHIKESSDKQAVILPEVAVAFGDLFLADIRRYREDKLAGTGVVPIFPLWGIPTDQLARQMIDGGLRARLTCVDPKQLAPSFAGREFDTAFLEEIPASVDPCGERGEFHTFAYDGPMFGRAVLLRSGEVVERDGFVFADLLPVTP